ELLAHVVLVEDELALDVVDRCEVLVEHGEAVLGEVEVALGEMLGNTERIEELESDAAFLVEGFDDVVLERLETAGPPEAVALRRVAVRHRLRLLGEERGDGEDLRREAEKALDAVAHERDDLVAGFIVAQQVDLVQDDD